MSRRGLTGKVVLLDTGIFVALLNRTDRWHEQACSLFLLPRPRWCTSLLVVSEAYAWFLHRLGEEAARRFRALLADLDGLQLFEMTASDHRGTLRVLDQLRGTKLTYVDAASLHYLKQHSIGTVWSTDRHLGLFGANVLP